MSEPDEDLVQLVADAIAGVTPPTRRFNPADRTGLAHEVKYAGSTVARFSTREQAQEYAAEVLRDRRARAAIAAVFAWQRIETAPKDGTDVLIFPPMTVALKTPDAWTDGTGATLRPTHWMPLPPAPEGA